ncbi:hypothetical protein ACU8KH_04808 [Lachancea thermotolerans]
MNEIKFNILESRSLTRGANIYYLVHSTVLWQIPKDEFGGELEPKIRGR